MAGAMSEILSFVATFFLIICFSVSLFQMRYFIRKYEGINGNHVLLSTIQFTSCLFAFLILIYAFLTSNFDFQLVYSNSHTDKPLLYKLFIASSTDYFGANPNLFLIFSELILYDLLSSVLIVSIMNFFLITC